MGRPHNSDDNIDEQDLESEKCTSPCEKEHDRFEWQCGKHNSIAKQTPKDDGRIEPVSIHQVKAGSYFVKMRIENIKIDARIDSGA